MCQIITNQCADNWSEQTVCDQRSNLGRPLFLVLPSSAKDKPQLTIWFKAEVALILFSPASTSQTAILPDYYSFLFDQAEILISCLGVSSLTAFK
jgi:hypothetical protein